MDPLTLLGLTTAALALMSEEDRQRADEEASEQMSRALLGLTEWHIAGSYDWNDWRETVMAPTFDAALAKMVEDNPSSQPELDRIYVAIRGGHQRYELNRALPLHVGFQAEQDIGVVTIFPRAPGTILRGLLHSAYAVVPFEVDVKNEVGELTDKELRDFADDIRLEQELVKYPESGCDVLTVQGGDVHMVAGYRTALSDL